MATVTTGRTLDADGEPIAGTGFQVTTDGDLADLLRARIGPLTSHPTRATWGAPLVDTAERFRSVSVFGPDYAGPPEHYHEVSTERFEVRSGAVVFDLDGRRERVTAGERLTVPTGTRHGFRSAGGRAVVITEIFPPGRIRHVLPTLGGIAHDDAVDADSLLQQAVIADRLARDTVFTGQDPRVTRPLSALLAPVARLAGYHGGYAKYDTDAFWRQHVEQPEL